MVKLCLCGTKCDHYLLWLSIQEVLLSSWRYFPATICVYVRRQCLIRVNNLYGLLLHDRELGWNLKLTSLDFKHDPQISLEYKSPMSQKYLDCVYSDPKSCETRNTSPLKRRELHACPGKMDKEQNTYR